MEVNDVSMGILSYTQNIDLAESEVITSLDYKVVTAGSHVGGLCNFEIVTNQKTFGPYGTVECGRSPNVARSQTVPNGMSFYDFFQSIARLSDNALPTGAKYLAFDDVYGR